MNNLAKPGLWDAACLSNEDPAHPCPLAVRWRGWMAAGQGWANRGTLQGSLPLCRWDGRGRSLPVPTLLHVRKPRADLQSPTAGSASHSLSPMTSISMLSARPSVIPQGSRAILCALRQPTYGVQSRFTLNEGPYLYCREGN